MSGYSDNFDDFRKQLGFGRHERGRHVLLIRNTAEYAVYLHRLVGYWVMNDEKADKIVDEWMEKTKDQVPLTERNVERALEAAGYAIIDYYRSLTSNTVPGLRKGEKPRFTHPGAWADRSGILATSYRFRVNKKEEVHVK